MVDLEEIKAEAVSAAHKAGELIVAPTRGNSIKIRHKQGSELVTTADLEADEIIREHLGSRFNGHRFFTEEGTREAGVVHAPLLEETYAAINDGGASRNGSPIRVSDISDLRLALIGTGFPHDRSDLSPAIERIERLLTECQDIRRAGSPALDICYVATGQLDAHCETLAPWDIAAAGLIASEAGARSGNLVPGDSALPPALRGEEYVIASPGIFDPLCRILREAISSSRE